MGVLKNDSLKKLLKDLKDWFALKAQTVFSVNGTTPVNGDVSIESVDRADNLNTEKMLQMDGTAVIRSSGKNASIKDGDAFLLRILGNRNHGSYEPTCITVEVTQAQRTEGEEEIEVNVDRDAFIAATVNDAVVTFNYTSSWSPALTGYGVTVTGTPKSGDSIKVTYVNSRLGKIYPAKPTAMHSTGWNLYNNASGYKYARVCKYSNRSGYLFRVGGTYTALKFSEILNGTKTTITPTNGQFNLPNNATEGYIHVTGGNDTNTYILNEWDDWTGGYAGDFKAYEESVIDLSWAVNEYFPNGLYQVGNVRDEIDLNTQTCISRIERKDLNNLASVIASGRAYEYDMDYVYVVREEPVVNRIPDAHYIDGYYVANDHGNEFFDTTPENVLVMFSALYGSNIKNKLERDVLTISEQTLTSAQKTQVQANLGLSVTNDLTTSTSGHVLDARQGKALSDMIDDGRTIASSSATSNNQIRYRGEVISNTADGYYILYAMTYNGDLYIYSFRAKSGTVITVREPATPRLTCTLSSASNVYVLKSSIETGVAYKVVRIDA